MTPDDLLIHKIVLTEKAVQSSKSWEEDTSFLSSSSQFDLSSKIELWLMNLDKNWPKTWPSFWPSMWLWSKVKKIGFSLHAIFPAKMHNSDFCIICNFILSTQPDLEIMIRGSFFGTGLWGVWIIECVTRRVVELVKNVKHRWQTFPMLDLQNWILNVWLSLDYQTDNTWSPQ